MGCKMTICIFNGDMSRGGGTERITQILANALGDTGQYRIIVLNLNNVKGISYYPLSEKLEMHTLKKEGIVNKILEMRRFVRKQKINVVINVDIMLGIYSFPATFLTRIRIISWEMFNIRNDIGSKHTEAFRKFCLRFSAYYINQTKGDMEAFKKELPVRCPITYIYNPCEIDYDYTGYDAESKTIVTAGHFYYTKGYDLAVEVAKHVFAKHPDWRWEFYGDGSQLERVKNKVHLYGLEDKVIFCGRTSNINEAYKKAAMYVMTSRTEGFGLVLTEAKSCNLPTLAYDIDFGPREIIEDNVSGYLVSAFDDVCMAERIDELIENQEKRIAFSKMSKNNCDKFSLEYFVKRWCEVLQGCC